MVRCSVSDNLSDASEHPQLSGRGPQIVMGESLLPFESLIIQEPHEMKAPMTTVSLESSNNFPITMLFVNRVFHPLP